MLRDREPPGASIARVVLIAAAVALIGSAADTPGARGATATVPRGDAAVVVDQPLTKRTLNHWIWIAAKSQAAQSPGAPVIAPTDPPRFDRCVAKVRRVIPTLRHFATRKLRQDCEQLFVALSGQTMDFLIKARWYEADAAAHDISIARARVVRAFRIGRREQFSSLTAFRRFLKQTGQTITDILFRFRLNLTYDALLKAEHGNSRGLDAEVMSQYRPTTECARYYVMSDCTNSPKPPGPAPAGSFGGSFLPPRSSS